MIRLSHPLLEKSLTASSWRCHPRQRRRCTGLGGGRKGSISTSMPGVYNELHQRHYQATVCPLRWLCLHTPNTDTHRQTRHIQLSPRQSLSAPFCPVSALWMSYREFVLGNSTAAQSTKQCVRHANKDAYSTDITCLHKQTIERHTKGQQANDSAINTENSHT